LDQALAAGFSAETVAKRVRRGQWIALHHGVYCAATAKRTRELTAVAARLRVGETAMFSHLTAARLLGFDIRSDSPFTWLTTPLPSGARSFGLVKVVRTRHLVTPQYAFGHPVTPPPRMFVDLAGVLDAAAWVGTLYDAVRRSQVSVSAILAEADLIGGGRRGLNMLRRESASFDPAFEMMVEAKVGLALESAGVSMTPQHELWDGPFLVARFDLADAELLHAVEIDGFAAHSTRAQQRRDRVRDRGTSKRGWTTSRFDATEALRDLDGVVRDVLDVRARLKLSRRQAG
jgi:very-short-patch-repair endonuclease